MMMKWIRGLRLHSLQVQLTLILAIIGLCTGTLCASMLSQSATKTIQTNTFKQIDTMLIHQAYNIDLAMNELSSLAMTLSTSEALRVVMAYDRVRHYDSISAYRDYLEAANNITIQNTVLDALYVYRKDGVILGKDRYSNIFISQSVNFRQTVGRVTYDSPLLPTNTDSMYAIHFLGYAQKSSFNYLDNITEDYPVLVFGYPFHDERKNAVWLVLLVREDTMQKLYTGQEEGLGIQYMISEEGEIVSFTEPNLLGQSDPLFEDSILNAGKTVTIRDDEGRDYYITVMETSANGLYLVSKIAVSNVFADIEQMNRLMLAMILLMVCILPFVSVILARRLLRPLNRLSSYMHDVGMGSYIQIPEPLPRNEMGALYESFNHMSASIQKLTGDNKRISDERRTAELKALQAYINPHFLHNTVLTMRWMAMMLNANHLSDALAHFGGMLIPLYADQKTMWALSQEKAFLTNYIQVMNYRYGNGVETTIDIPDELAEHKCLKLLTQPLVENAFSYAIDTSTGVGKIEITMRREGEFLIIRVRDWGGGIERGKLEALRMACENNCDGAGKGMGICNTAQRLRLFYGGEAQMDIESGPDGTRGTLTLPWAYEEE